MTPPLPTPPQPRITRKPGWAGRSDRKEYWTTVGVIIAAAVVLALLPFKSTAAVLTVAWTYAYARRLHDLGRSAWLQLWLWLAQVAMVVAAFVVLGPQALLTSPSPPNAEGPFVAFGLVLFAALLLQVVFTVWLGLRAGSPAPNRYGASAAEPDVPMMFD